MLPRRIYLDWNATAPLCAAARSAIERALEVCGNPSSLHAEGRAARDLIERARHAVATLVGRPREQIVFTSGGTEANWLGVMALAALAEQRGRPRVVAALPIDHPSLAGAVAELARRGWEVRTLEMRPSGDEVVPAVEPIGLVVGALVHHELGTIPQTLVPWARACGALVHLDAVQAAGKRPLADVDADALAVSAHKLGGPMGAGALAIAADDGLPAAFAGHQERGRRPGTENVLGIVGFGAAAAEADPAAWPRVVELGARLERGLGAIDGVVILGAGAARIGGTTLASFAGARGQDLVIALDLAGVSVSTGAACTSGSVKPSPALLALGFTPEQAREVVRFSLGRTTTADDIDHVLALLPAIVARARAA